MQVQMRVWASQESKWLIRRLAALEVALNTENAAKQKAANPALGDTLVVAAPGPPQRLPAQQEDFLKVCSCGCACTALAGVRPCLAHGCLPPSSLAAQWGGAVITRHTEIWLLGLIIYVHAKAKAKGPFQGIWRVWVPAGCRGPEAFSTIVFECMMIVFGQALEQGSSS